MKASITIKVPTYNCDISFIVTDTIDKVSHGIYKKYKIPEAYEDGNEGILISPNINKYYLVIDTKYLTHNTIAHEIYHASWGVTSDRGIVDEEAQAWLCGHITGVVYKFLDNKKFTVKHS